MRSALKKKAAISASSKSIYDILDVNDKIFLNDEELGYLLKINLIGLTTEGLPNRTRSKVVKSAICTAIGYPTPKSFKKCKPRFLSQNFDTYVQKSLNLQIWNEEISDTRRYVIIQVSGRDVITNVRVINGQELAKLDTTGTLTQKYQARLGTLSKNPDIFSIADTENLIQIIPKKATTLSKVLPTDIPSENALLPLASIASKLKSMIGTEFRAIGSDQERNRGAILHAAVCECLGYKEFGDNGKFPDILNQLLEVKLQMSPTIDLGLVLPTSEKPFLEVGGLSIRHCDIRYVIFEAEQSGKNIKLTNFALGTGQDFLNKFTLFAGKVLNKKIQLPLPKNFFES